MAQNAIVAAIATAPGMGGIAVVRVSGEGALSVLKKAFSRKGGYEPRKMYHGYVLGEGGERLDEALAVYFPAPHSYTAEDVAEIQCHGGDVAARRALAAVLRAGAVPAEPGEFTKRAFLNGRIDLSQAEAVMQMISARSEAAARASMRQLTGGVSAKIRPILEQLTGIQSLIEASDDFPEEIDEETGSAELRSRLLTVKAEIDALSDERAARIVTGGYSAVLAGRPNVGKSSLLNSLLGAERAIVTDIPGTTRDAISHTMTVNGVNVELTDTAGQRKTADAVEKIGVERARSAAQNADLVLLVLDGTQELTASDRELLAEADERCCVCVNKCDAGVKLDVDLIKRDYNVPILETSAVTGQGMDELKALIARRAAPPDTALVTERHIESARAAASELEGALNALDAGYPMDVCAVHIASALDVLSEITGENARESVIDRVFRDFCVGK